MTDRLDAIEEDIQELEEVSDTKVGDKYLYVVTVGDCDSIDFRPKIAEFLYENLDFTPTLELRVNEDNDGLIAIIGEEIEHPMQVVTLYAGLLELSDRETYQSLTKTSEIAEELYEGDNPKEFAAGVINVVSTTINQEPIELSELNNSLNLDAQKLQRETKRIVDHVVDE